MRLLHVIYNRMASLWIFIALITGLMMAGCSSGDQLPSEKTRLARVLINGIIYEGRVTGDDLFIAENAPGMPPDYTEEFPIVPASEADFLTPVPPRSVIGIHHTAFASDLNHLTQGGYYVPNPPDLYGRFSESIAHPGAPIAIPHDAGRVVASPQLVVAIGSEAAKLQPEAVDAVIRGHILGVDLYEPELYANRGWVMGRAADGWAPAGPWMVEGMPEADIHLELVVDGDQTISYELADPAELIRLWISRMSRIITLQEGDLIFMGYPADLANDLPEVIPGQKFVARGTNLGELTHTLLKAPPSPEFPVGRVSVSAVPSVYHDVSSVLSPWSPGRNPKIFCVVRNRTDADSPEVINLNEELEDRIRLKMPNSLALPTGEIQISHDARNLNWEAELVVVIGKRARQVNVDEAWGYIAGYTIGNDISENNWGGIFGKSGDGWSVLGDVLATGGDWQNWQIKTIVNGKVKQSGTTGLLRYSPADVVAYLSSRITLEPGDLIYLGTVPRTPNTRQAMKAGDQVDVVIENMGRISSSVVPK